jgi:hypothetical protein
MAEINYPKLGELISNYSPFLFPVIRYWLNLNSSQEYRRPFQVTPFPEITL